MAQPFAQIPMHGPQGRGQPRRPRKHPSGWEHSIKRICITKAVYSKWLVVKEENSFVNDDAVAHYLLSLYE